MDAARRRRATAATREIAVAAGLSVDGVVQLHDSNKLTLWLRPADVVARVAVAGEVDAEFELALARQLVAVDAPVVAPDPRIGPQPSEVAGSTITWWTYADHDPAGCSADAYADALRRLHAGLREVDLPAPSALDRVASAQELVADPVRMPQLSGRDRGFLADTLDTLAEAVLQSGSVQLLHGEPHPGNLLATRSGPLFIDLETACRGPVEFDVAHAPDEVAVHYPGLDPELVAQCRLLVLAMITTWRWDVDDRFPNGHARGRDWLTQLRAAVRGEASAEPL